MNKDKEMTGYIYLISSDINDKIYIGKHSSKKRDNFYFGRGKLIAEAIDKHGKEHFSQHILEICYDYEDLNNAEIKWIQKYKDDGYDMYNLVSGGDGLTSEEASYYATKRWESMSKVDRQNHMKKTREAYFEKYPNGIVDVMKLDHNICKECGAPIGSHKKNCSQYRVGPICNECGGLRGQHFKNCSKFTAPPPRSQETREKLRQVALNRPDGHWEQVSQSLKDKWKDPDFVKVHTCEECGGKSGNHKKYCSQSR